MSNQAAIEKLLVESLRWTRDHKGQKYRHAIPCEWCLQQGLCHALAVLTGATTGEVRKVYTDKVNNENRRRVVSRRPAKKKRVVRIKK